MKLNTFNYLLLYGLTGLSWILLTSTASGAPPTLSTPTVTSVTSTTAVLGATVDTDGGTSPVSERGTVWQPGPGSSPVTNAWAEGSGLGIFSHTRGDTGDPSGPLPSGSQVIFRGYAVNADGTGYSPDGSFYTEPSTQASGVSIDQIDYYSFRVNWTVPPDADGVLVAIRQSSVNNTYPSDGVEYTANPRIGQGDTLNPSCIFYCDWAVYKGAETSVVVTGLKAGYTHAVAVYAYKGSGTGTSGINYIQTRDTANTASAATTLQTGHNNDPTVLSLVGGEQQDNGILDCGNCHGVHHTPGLLPRNEDQYNKCFACHNPSGSANAKANIGLHRADGSVDCGSCHDMHSFTTEQYYAVDTDHGYGSNHNLSFVRSNTAKYVNVTDFGKDALEPALFFEKPRDFAYPDTDPPYNAICQTCHTETSFHTNDGSGDQTHQVGTDCTWCHPHKNNSGSVNSAFAASGGCTICHATDQDAGDGAPSRRAVMGEFSATSHHVLGGSATDADCAVCHYESIDDDFHQNNTVDLRDPDDGTAATLISFTQFSRDISSNSLETWVIDVQDNVCFKCHDSDGATATNISGNPLQPFSSGDRDVPNVYDQFDPGNSYHHAIRAAGTNPYTISTATNGDHITMEPPWNQGGDHNMISCFDCHDTSGHGGILNAGNNQRMLRVFIDLDRMEAESGRTCRNNPPEQRCEVSIGTSIETFCTLCHKSTIYVTSGTQQRDGTHFLQHGINGHVSTINNLGCLGCHGGIAEHQHLLNDPPYNGFARGNIHGGSFVWPSGTFSSGVTTEFFLVGGWLDGWTETDVPGVFGCGGGDCNHAGSDAPDGWGNTYTATY